MAKTTKMQIIESVKCEAVNQIKYRGYIINIYRVTRVELSYGITDSSGLHVCMADCLGDAEEQINSIINGESPAKKAAAAIRKLNKKL